MTVRLSTKSTHSVSLTVFKKMATQSYLKSCCGMPSKSWTNGTTIWGICLLRALRGPCSKFAVWRTSTEAMLVTISSKFATCTRNCSILKRQSTVRMMPNFQSSIMLAHSQTLDLTSISHKSLQSTSAFNLRVSLRSRAATHRVRPHWSPWLPMDSSAPRLQSSKRRRSNSRVTWPEPTQSQKCWQMVPMTVTRRCMTIRWQALLKHLTFSRSSSHGTSPTTKQSSIWTVACSKISILTSKATPRLSKLTITSLSDLSRSRVWVTHLRGCWLCVHKLTLSIWSLTSFKLLQRTHQSFVLDSQWLEMTWIKSTLWRPLARMMLQRTRESSSAWSKPRSSSQPLSHWDSTLLRRQLFCLIRSCLTMPAWSMRQIVWLPWVMGQTEQSSWAIGLWTRICSCWTPPASTRRCSTESSPP